MPATSARSLFELKQKNNIDNNIDNNINNINIQPYQVEGIGVDVLDGLYSPEIDR